MLQPGPPTEAMDIVHTDVLNRVAGKSIDGHKFAIRFADSVSRFISVYFMGSRKKMFGNVPRVLCGHGENKVDIFGWNKGVCDF